MKRILAAFIFLIVFVVGMAWTTQPSYTVIRTLIAVIQKDQTVFLKHVDVDRVADGLVEDFTSVMLRDLGIDIQDSSLGAMMATQFITGFRISGLNLVKTNIQGYFTGQAPTGGEAQTGVFSSAIAFYLFQSRDFSLKPYWKTEKDSDFAIVTFTLMHKPTKIDYPIRFRLEKQVGEWRVTRIYNVIEAYLSHSN